MFTYLGFDDRFLIHENIGQWLGRNDAYLVLGLGFIEIGLLVWLGNLRQKTKKLWADICLISFAWEILKQHIRRK